MKPYVPSQKNWMKVFLEESFTQTQWRPFRLFKGLMTDELRVQKTED
ncbi:hypothetical protein LEP1GSC133_4662 [Leptospira borgpetersenii serovar Pomona str. 200901868]|uniref:Uncharacterized protein n=1 Tax=Leptospira borgpetersenii serovar Pomona str. 200901868 TaxID=1192866 RepID=M6W7I9_LEPBO|nr:hypothetical protein LEP1GSC133_4662 [Leptospira borgpetersenii serovar Pomona str. 200901868]